MSVIFNQLRIADDGKRMYINLHVNEADYFENIYLDSLTIIPADKVLETSPTVPSEDYLYKKVFEDGTRRADLVLQPTYFNESFAGNTLSKDLFFVYVKVKGTPDTCTPCRLDEEITLGVIFDVNMLYQIVMQQTRQLVNKCDIPQKFLDLILLWNGFKAAIETEHYVVAIDFWKKIFRNKNSSNLFIEGCGCHG